MANKKITELATASNPSGPELVEVVQGGVNKKMTIDQIVDSITASDVSNTPSGNISATDVQAAINELDTEKQAALGFTPENVSNKATDFSTLNNTLYPTTQAVESRILAALAGLKWKESVVVATTANITLSGEQTIDGVLTSASRVLVKNQSTQSQNGIYVSAAGAWTRSTDADSAAELEGATVRVQQGTSNSDTTWIQTTDGITLGSSNIVWTQFGVSAPDATPSVKGIAKLYTATGSNTDGSMDQNSITNAVIGTQDLFIPASAMWPRVTNGCASLTQTEVATSLFNIQTLDFDSSTQEFAQFQIAFPRNWNNGTITAKVYWTATSGSGSVVFGISGGAYSNDDALSVALGTAQTVTDTLLATNDLHITPVSSAITLAGTPADADFIALQLSRNPADGGDDFNADAKVLGVVITLTTDAAVAS